MALKYDIQNENFDYFFLEQSAGMTQAQKELLPIDLLYKIYVKGNRVNSKSTSKLNFFEKIFVLIKGLNKRWLLIVEDEKGMGEEEFFKFKELTKKKSTGNSPLIILPRVNLYWLMQNYSTLSIS